MASELEEAATELAFFILNNDRGSVDFGIQLLAWNSAVQKWRKPRYMRAAYLYLCAANSRKEHPHA